MKQLKFQSHNSLVGRTRILSALFHCQIASFTCGYSLSHRVAVQNKDPLQLPVNVHIFTNRIFGNIPERRAQKPAADFNTFNIPKKDAKPRLVKEKVSRECVYSVLKDNGFYITGLFISFCKYLPKICFCAGRD